MKNASLSIYETSTRVSFSFLSLTQFHISFLRLQGKRRGEGVSAASPAGVAGRRWPARQRKCWVHVYLEFISLEEIEFEHFEKERAYFGAENLWVLAAYLRRPHSNNNSHVNNQT
jgi:hypothetical protein